MEARSALRALGWRHSQNVRACVWVALRGGGIELPPEHGCNVLTDRTCEWRRHRIAHLAVLLKTRKRVWPDEAVIESLESSALANAYDPIVLIVNGTHWREVAASCPKRVARPIGMKAVVPGPRITLSGLKQSENGEHRGRVRCWFVVRNMLGAGCKHIRQVS